MSYIIQNGRRWKTDQVGGNTILVAWGDYIVSADQSLVTGNPGDTVNVTFTIMSYDGQPTTDEITFTTSYNGEESTATTVNQTVVVPITIPELGSFSFSAYGENIVGTSVSVQSVTPPPSLSDQLEMLKAQNAEILFALVSNDLM